MNIQSIIVFNKHLFSNIIAPIFFIWFGTFPAYANDSNVTSDSELEKIVQNYTACIRRHKENEVTATDEGISEIEQTIQTYTTRLLSGEGSKADWLSLIKITDNLLNNISTLMQSIPQAKQSILQEIQKIKQQMSNAKTIEEAEQYRAIMRLYIKEFRKLNANEKQLNNLYKKLKHQQKCYGATLQQ
jgi:exonuclease VII large subunit